MTSSLPPIGRASARPPAASGPELERPSHQAVPSPDKPASAGVAGADSSYTEAAGEAKAPAKRLGETKKTPREEFSKPGIPAAAIHDPFIGTQACSDDRPPPHKPKPVNR
jgi:hypothetical protein